MAGDQARVNTLNQRPPNPDGQYVLYWMQHSQRAWDNPALEHAAQLTQSLKLPLKVLFVVDPDYPEANARHFTFMLEGIREVAEAVAARGAHFALRLGNPPDVAVHEANNAAAVVTDRGYLRHLVAWRQALAEAAPCTVQMVEGDVIVPVERASDKKEVGARTIRKKIHRQLGDYVDLPQPERLGKRAKGLASAADRALSDVPAFVTELRCDASVGAVPGFPGGQSHARAMLDAFIAGSLPAYGDGRADIVERNVSYLSPYLHFGQISPLRVLLAVQDARVKDESKDSFIEEMLVRRELAVNFVHYEPNYDSFDALPGWAQDTLMHHAGDAREELRTAQELEAGKTGDPYWNAAMHEMRITGYLHNHMRMYWGKRILAYMQDPREAFATVLTLNNKYFLDGRDANSFANVAWIFGQHDRGWPERAVFGKVRTMTASGLERKFDIKAYVRWANSL